MSEIQLHRTRLFPKLEGAHRYVLSGIAECCDWTILTDYESTEYELRGDLRAEPRTVFLSMRGFFNSLPIFYEEILPTIASPFVLISGSEDITIPRQLDRRWRPFNAAERTLIQTIRKDARVLHWFIENRDEPMPKTSSLPVGWDNSGNQDGIARIPTDLTPIHARPLKILCAHRIRGGVQWDVRRKVTSLCRTRFAGFTNLLEQEVSESVYEQEVRQHPFVFCVEGGGLDPSPKAWNCLANGAIPIVKSSALDDAYGLLPVAFVEEWDEACVNPERLDDWLNELGPHFSDAKLNERLWHRLSLEFWWSRIRRAYYTRRSTLHRWAYRSGLLR